jgi:hypothetical protein
MNEPVVVYRHKGPGFIAGVPRRDLTERDLPNLTARQMREIEAGPFYAAATSKAARSAIADAEPIATPAAPPAGAGEAADTPAGRRSKE